MNCREKEFGLGIGSIKPTRIGSAWVTGTRLGRQALVWYARLKDFCASWRL